jgi:hypothetical protein
MQRQGNGKAKIMKGGFFDARMVITVVVLRNVL